MVMPVNDFNNHSQMICCSTAPTRVPPGGFLLERPRQLPTGTRQRQLCQPQIQQWRNGVLHTGQCQMLVNEN